MPKHGASKKEGKPPRKQRGCSMKIWKHFCTITKHKWLVMGHCFRVGLIRQGLLHDLSKYGWREFSLGCKYYLGTESPHNGERAAYGYSLAWLHHKGRNRHHLEYWVDYGPDKTRGLVGMKMPKPYVIEMFLDRVCASKNYQGKDYTDASAWNYHLRSKDHLPLHPDTRALLEQLLIMLREEGEKKTFSYIRNVVRRKEFPY